MVSTTIDTVNNVGASIKVVGGADEVHQLLHPSFTIRIESPRVMKLRRGRVALKTVASGAAEREGIASFHLPYEAYASEGPSPPMCTSSLLSKAMNPVQWPHRSIQR